MNSNCGIPEFGNIFNRTPRAMAEVRGSNQYPSIRGNVWFYETGIGVLVVADIAGLPNSNVGGNIPIFAFHIHEGGECSGNSTDPFANVLTHYNPQNLPHPYHAGDLPPLFGVNGYAFTVVLTNRFDIDEIIGRTVVVHSAPDDFTSQPSGNSGSKIACGVIQRWV